MKDTEFTTDERTVFLTVLTNETYIRGVKALKRSLRNAKSKHDLIILVPQSKAENLRYALENNRILDQHCRLVVKEDVNIIYPEGIVFKEHYWANTFFKLSVANCTEFKKIVLLDSDMLIARNIDHLFDKPHYSACAAGHCVQPDWVKLNSGIMVINPSVDFYKKLLDCVEPAMRRRYSEGNNISDQDVFQEAFPDWEEHGELQLSEKYNCFFSCIRFFVQKENIRFNDIAVVHFVGETKPWSKGCFTKENLRKCLSMIIHGRFYELKVFIEYLLLSV